MHSRTFFQTFSKIISVTLQEASENKEKMIYQSIDWHDFVIVEVIEFDDDDEALPPPLPPQPVVSMPCVLAVRAVLKLKCGVHLGG